ncbi:uncharacterized protein LOC112271651 [Brachypodium distachyon]|uniref:uncharacterized protein LOC112271651 n=1 Tax=Brachypodium distachyon TaxID=15368 RepID=UPI000D0CFC1E|nr:uncharacterized protein LOC112271651 [Brachypodium distachyon]|eukprot:XP_024317153.1 uncharacterized protein LOC112271651 [Brachypodium distachyon]
MTKLSGALAPGATGLLMVLAAPPTPTIAIVAAPPVPTWGLPPLVMVAVRGFLLKVVGAAGEPEVAPAPSLAAPATTVAVTTAAPGTAPGDAPAAADAAGADSSAV